jgi:hypothetical protein
MKRREFKVALGSVAVFYAAEFVGKILYGANPADMPVRQPRSSNW